MNNSSNASFIQIWRLLIQPIAHVALVQINQSFIFQQIHSLAVVWSERVCKVKVCVVFQYKHSKEAIFLGDLLIVLLSDHQIPQSKVISHHSQQQQQSVTSFQNGVRLKRRNLLSRCLAIGNGTYPAKFTWGTWAQMLPSMRLRKSSLNTETSEMCGWPGTRPDSLSSSLKTHETLKTQYEA